MDSSLAGWAGEQGVNLPKPSCHPFSPQACRSHLATAHTSHRGPESGGRRGSRAAGGSTPAHSGSHRVTQPPGGSAAAAPGPGATSGSPQHALGTACPGFLPPSLGLNALRKYTDRAVSSGLLSSTLVWEGGRILLYLPACTYIGGPLRSPHNVDSRYLGLSPRASVKSEIRDREPSAGNGAISEPLG